MILIITHKEDYTVDFIINKLNKKGIPYYRFNCEDIDKYTYNFELQSKFNFELNGVKYFKSVWFRRTKLPDLDIKDTDERLYILGDYDSLFDNIFSLIKAERWLSHPTYINRAENKIYQLKTAQKVGFKIPNTLITNNNSRIKNFAIKNDNNIIIKPIRQGRIKTGNGFKTIFTNKLPVNIISQLENYALTPCIYQQYVDKKYELRITVVGNKVFSAKVESQKYAQTEIDWRKEKIPFQKYVLPKEIENKCIKLTKELNLSFGAIDLIKNNNDDYIFLEINPNGQWVWLETDANLLISDEIIKYLTI